MKNVIIALGAVILIGIASCSKDQKVVESIVGSWEAVTIDGETVPDSLKTVTTFEDCKLSKEEYCPMSIEDQSGISSEVGDIEYKVMNKGTKLVQKYEIPNIGAFQLSADIIELTETTLTLKYSLNGSETTTEFVKI